MSNTTSLMTSTKSIGSPPRARRGDAAVLAQYIQDITHPSAEERAAAA